jgi:hypothetical protein
MQVRKASLSLALALGLLLLLPNPALAYVGPGAGMELFNYFFALVAWALVALGAVLMWPFYALLARLRKAAGAPTPEPEDPPTASLPESPGDGSHDQP